MEIYPLATREAAKGILRTPTGRIIVVAGERGGFNLPGGGCDPDERPEATLFREVREEIGVSADQLTDVQAIGGTWGVVTPKNGENRRAVWHLFEGLLQVEADELRYSNEITAVDGLSASEILEHPNMSRLAKQAVRHAMSVSENKYRP